MCYTLMGIMAFEMMSSKVHWASDYPLGLFIGYVVGKAAANRRIKKIDTNDGLGWKKTERVKTEFTTVQLEGYTTFGVLFSF